MLRRLAVSLAARGAGLEGLGLLLSETTPRQLPFAAAAFSGALDGVPRCSSSSSSSSRSSSCSYAVLCHPQQQVCHLHKQQPALPLLQQLAPAGPVLPLAAASARQAALLQHADGQQLQQQRSLLGVVKHKNYQNHNQQRRPKYKIKTPSAVKRRVIVGEDGTMWRMQAGRRHKRYKKGRKRLLALKGMVPLHSADAAKLRKLGYKRTWWHMQKA